MYSVTLVWSDKCILVVVCDVSTSQVLKQVPYVCNPVTVGHLSVAVIMEALVFPEYTPDLINLVVLVVPNELPVISKSNTLIQGVVDHLSEVHEIDEVRFIYTPFFDATRAVLELNKTGHEFKVKDQMLMVRMFAGTAASADYVYLINKTKKGWRAHEIASVTDETPPNVSDSKFDAALVKRLVIYENGYTTDVKEMVTFIDKSKTTVIPYFRHSSVGSACAYLSRVLLDLEKDLSSYVPMGFHWTNLAFGSKDLDTKVNFNVYDVLPCMKTVDFTPRTCVCNRFVQNFGCHEASISMWEGKENQQLRISVFIGKNGEFGSRVYAKKGSKYVLFDSFNDDLVYDYASSITVTPEFISANYWNNGVFTEAIDVNGLSKIPLKISFFEDVPVVGSAVTETMKPVKHNLVKLFDKKWVAKKVREGATDLVFDSEKNLQVIVETRKGLRRISPMLILATVVRSVVRLVQQKSGQKFVEFNFMEEVPNVPGSELFELVMQHKYGELDV